MSEQNFNKLTAAETERLSILAEEMGEAIQIIGKILRHGYESKNPFDTEGKTNRELLEKEMGDVADSLLRMEEADDLDSVMVEHHMIVKGSKIGKYLHHQNEERPEKSDYNNSEYKLIMRHQIKDLDKNQIQLIKDFGVDFCAVLDIIGASGSSRELSLAKTKIEEAVMWATKHLTS
jgi:hypothetical protein